MRVCVGSVFEIEVRREAGRAITLEWLELKRNHQASNSMHQLHQQYVAINVWRVQYSSIFLSLSEVSRKGNENCRSRENRFQEETIVT